MPTVSNATLSLSEDNGIIKMTILFVPVFTSVEKDLSALGCTFHAHYTVHAVDYGVVQTAELAGISIPNMPFVPGPLNLPAPPCVTIVEVNRSLLDEDQGSANADEFKVKIVLHTLVESEFSAAAYTNQGTIIG